MKQCFGYVRVSTQKQGEGISLDAQKDAIEYFASKNDISIVKWFEETQTAAKKGRPVFAELTKTLKRGKADGVVMHKIDRSARNFFDWAKIGELADSGIEVHFATESLDFQSRGGRLTANIQMAVAEDYVRNLKAEIHKGQHAQLERGYYPFSAPIGYLNNGKKKLKTIDPVLGPFIRQTFELYASGQYSFESLRQEMAKHGFKQANGKPRSRGCIEAILGNPFYMGLIRIKATGETYQGAHEPTITATTYEQVQLLKADRKSKQVTRHQHLFRGLFACKQCDRSMIPEKQKGHCYYRCHYSGCAGNSIREEPLDKAIYNTLTTIRLPQCVSVLIDTRIKQSAKELNTKNSIQSIELQLANLSDRLVKLEDAAIDQIISRENFLQRKETMLIEKAKLETAIKKSRDWELSPGYIRRFLERMKNLAEHYQNAEAPEKREIVEIATSNRKVFDKKVYI